jgi:hypothetical protein
MLSITAESRSLVAVGKQWYKDDLRRGDPIFSAVKPLSRVWRRMTACLQVLYLLCNRQEGEGKTVLGK